MKELSTEPAKPKRQAKRRASRRAKGQTGPQTGPETGPEPARKAARRRRQSPVAAAAVAAAYPDPMREGAESPTAVEAAAPVARRVAHALEDRGTFLLLLAPFLVMTLVISAFHVPIEREVLRADPSPHQRSLLRPSVPFATLLPLAPTAALSGTASEPSAPTLGPAESIAALPPQIVLAALPAEREGGRCVVARAATDAPASPAALSPASFGRLLAGAAAEQTSELVVYQERYRQIAFPMGDVPSLYGVCTDVVVRAYRTLGIDLQVLVHRSRLGTGDSSIDHRRTETLRRFFERYGSSLPPSDFVEDYQPGDIVTYSRPSGRTSQSHIAIVSDAIAPSGRPMIVHNRGWGPLIEDALFANEITGHYRFSSSQAAAVVPEPPAAAVRQKSASATPAPAQVSADASR